MEFPPPNKTASQRDQGIQTRAQLANAGKKALLGKTQNYLIGEKSGPGGDFFSIHMGKRVPAPFVDVP